MPIDERNGKLYIMHEQITLGAPTRRVPVRGNDGMFSYYYNEDSNTWNRRAICQIVKPNTFDFSDISENKATWRILEWDGEYSLYGCNYTHSIFTNEALKCYRLENKTFKYQFNYNYHQRQYLEGNKNCGLWTTETGSVDYNYLFLEKAKANEWKTLADYGAEYSIDR